MGEATQMDMTQMPGPEEFNRLDAIDQKLLFSANEQRKKTRQSNADKKFKTFKNEDLAVFLNDWSLKTFIEVHALEPLDTN